MHYKKSLGQNFLQSKKIANFIIKSSDLKRTDNILEIGPGKGFLTEEIIKKVKKIVIVEKDDNLIKFLEKKFKIEIKSKKLEIINGDILKLKDFFIKNEEEFKLVANIPYYITGEIIKKFLTAKKQPKKIVLMVQKEVAERIISKKESILSLSVKVYGKPKYIETVKAKYFKPKPKVDSAILEINDISKDFFKKNKIKESLFFEFIKAGFSHKRKILINNLKNEFFNKKKIKSKKLEEIFIKNNIDLKIRAENLSKNDWKNILVEVL